MTKLCRVLCGKKVFNPARHDHAHTNNKSRVVNSALLTQTTLNRRSLVCRARIQQDGVSNAQASLLCAHSSVLLLLVVTP